VIFNQKTKGFQRSKRTLGGKPSATVFSVLELRAEHTQSTSPSEVENWQLAPKETPN